MSPKVVLPMEALDQLDMGLEQDSSRLLRLTCPYWGPATAATRYNPALLDIPPHVPQLPASLHIGITVAILPYERLPLAWYHAAVPPPASYRCETCPTQSSLDCPW